VTMTPSAAGVSDMRFAPSPPTGKERDTESGNDHFGARYYASSMGRFMSPDPVKITATRLLDPQGLNLYSYARNHPLISIDRDGNMTVVVVVQNRAASLSLYSDQGVKISDDQGLARGSRGPNRMIERGETPFGRYLFTGTEGGTSQSRLGTGYGTGKVRLNPDAGEAIESGRTDIRIHGGGTSATLVPDPYAGNQNLIATWGCVRLTNNDVNSLIGDIHSLQTKNGEQNVGDSIYVLDSNYLRFMSGQTNSDGASLYPDLSSVMNPLSSMGIDTSFTPPTQNTQQNTQTDTLQHEENH